MKLKSSLTHALLAVILLSLSAACGPKVAVKKGGPVDTGAASLAAARKYPEGRWTLQSLAVYPPGKPVVAVKGQGTLSYDDFSNLSMELRTDVATSDQLRAAGIEIQDGTISTTGRTAVDMQNRTLTYVIAGQPAGNTGPLALSRPRHWQVDGNVLTLTTKDDAGKPVSISKWRKIS